MVIENLGFTLKVNGDQYEVQNKYGLLKAGQFANDKVSEETAEQFLNEFVEEHSVWEAANGSCIKRVAYGTQKGELVQLQATYCEAEDVWYARSFDNELVCMGEIWTGCRYYDEVMNWLSDNFQIVSGLQASVYRWSYGDCTNNGVSEKRRKMYIVNTDSDSPALGAEPQDIRECVTIQARGKLYAHPAYMTKKWYMNGGNFIYSSDSRYEEMVGVPYPIPIFDRREGVRDCK